MVPLQPCWQVSAARRPKLVNPPERRKNSPKLVRRGLFQHNPPKAADPLVNWHAGGYLMSEVLDELARSDDPVDRELARVLREYQRIQSFARLVEFYRL